MTAQSLSSQDCGAPSRAPARLKKRPEFVAVSKGRRVHMTNFTLQAAERRGDTTFNAARIGLTVTKKAGSSVERNRMRRRLREALRLQERLPVRLSYDYVIVARRELMTADFSQLQADLVSALQKIHTARASRGDRKN